MKICKVCKCENEDGFIYCKNCGAQLEVLPPVKTEPVVEPVNTAPNPAPDNVYMNETVEPIKEQKTFTNSTPTLVPVKMLLPEPTNPEIKTIQTVYVTPAQKAAIQYDMSKNR